MAELSDDMVFKLDLGELEIDERRILERLLSSAEHVTAFAFVGDSKLVVSVRPVKGEDELARLLAATGLYPSSLDDLTRPLGGGMDAC